MLAYVEAGRAVGRDRASECILAGITSEVAPEPILFNQAKHISRRFVVSDALARTLAELAYANGGERT